LALPAILLNSIHKYKQSEALEMLKKSILLLAVLTMTLSLSNAQLMAEGISSAAGNEQQKKASPFLITGKLPHLTKLLIQQWDDPALQLSEEQKVRLLVVREETIAGVQRQGKKIAPLEKQVAKEIFAGKTPDQLHDLIQTIAGLKAEATMIHLKCIYDTKQILDQQQLEVLRKPQP
jgi:hypothetical protein